MRLSDKFRQAGNDGFRQTTKKESRAVAVEDLTQAPNWDRGRLARKERVARLRVRQQLAGDSVVKIEQ